MRTLSGKKKKKKKVVDKFKEIWGKTGYPRHSKGLCSKTEEAGKMI